jgi:hypothetical protein
MVLDQELRKQFRSTTSFLESFMGSDTFVRESIGPGPKSIDRRPTPDRKTVLPDHR